MDDRMFDFADFYTIVAKHLPDGAVLAEVGAADGTSAIFLAEALLNYGKTFKLWVIDSLAYGGADQLQTLMRHICEADLAQFVQLLPVDSLNAACRFPEVHFDFVFIDASHRLEHTKADIRLWYPKIKEGGYLAGHDYNGGEGAEVKQAVDAIIPASILRTRPTAKGCGIWYVKRHWQNGLQVGHQVRI